MVLTQNIDGRNAPGGRGPPFFQYRQVPSKEMNYEFLAQYSKNLAMYR